MKRFVLALPFVLSMNFGIAVPLQTWDICELLLAQTEITEEDAIKEADQALADLNPNLKFDAYGMVIPSHSQSSHRKIVTGLPDLKSRVEDAVSLGKHVLILNGGFDLIHKGHAIFASYSASAYMKNKGLRRDQLFVIVAADSDNLLGVYKASKWIGNGGKELFKRPVQRKEEFPELDYNTRALDLASIDAVDAVIMTPSPFELNQELIQNEVFKNSIRTGLSLLDSRADTLLSRQDKLGLSQREQHQHLTNLEPYMRAMGRLLLSGSLELIQEEFVRASNGQGSPIWNLTSWHFLLQAYLFDSLNESDQVARVLNKSDGDYLAVVAVMQNLAGANIFLMPENRVMSTTGILTDAGHEELIKAKRKSHLKH
jgi:hypothetical protein